MTDRINHRPSGRPAGPHDRRPPLRSTLTALALAATVAAIAVPTAAAAGTTAISGTPTAAATVALARYSVTTAGAGSSSGSGSVSDGAPAAAPAAPAGTSATPTAAHPGKGKHPRLRWLRAHRVRLAGVLHAQWTTKAKDGSYVTHDAIHGTVSAVATGATSVSVTAADHTTQSYATSAKTKVWKVTLVNGKRHTVKATLTAVTKNSEVIVEGTGAKGPFTATRILVQLPS